MRKLVTSRFRNVRAKWLVAPLIGLLTALAVLQAVVPGVLALNWSPQQVLGPSLSGPQGRQQLWRPSLRSNPLTGEALIIGDSGSGSGGYPAKELLLTRSTTLGSFSLINDSPTPDNADDKQSKLFSRIAFKPDGTAYIAWRYYGPSIGDSSNRWRAWMRVMRPNGSLEAGKAIGSTFAYSGGAGFLDLPDISWSSKTNKLYMVGAVGSTSNFSVGFAESSDEGATWNNFQTIIGNNPNVDRGGMFPKMCVDKNDNVHIASFWQGEVIARSRIGGVWQSNYTRLVTPDNSGGWFFRNFNSIACGQDGYAYTAWDGPGGIGIGRYTPGVGWGVANDNVGGNVSQSDLAVSGDNTLWLAYGGGPNYPGSKDYTYVVGSSNRGQSFGAADTAIFRDPWVSGGGLAMDYSAKSGKLHLASTYEQAARETWYSYAQLAPAQPPTPTPPANLRATTVSFKQINLTWEDKSSDETAFEVQYRRSDVGTWTSLPNAPANATSYTVDNLALGTGYFFQIRAINASGPSAWVGTNGNTYGISYLNFDRQIGGEAQKPLAAPPIVSLRDPLGNLITNYTGTVSLSLVAGPNGALISGGNTTSVGITAGSPAIATFGSVVLSKVGGGYQLRASATGTAVTSLSPAFEVRGLLVIDPVPTDKLANENFNLSVRVKNSDGTTVDYDGAIVLVLLPGSGASLNLTATASNGVATFTEVKLDRYGNNFQLLASRAAGSTDPLQDGYSNYFNIGAKLSFDVVTPASPTTYGSFSVTVKVRDFDNAILTNFNGPVKLTKASGPGNLYGPDSVSAVAGVVVFKQLALSADGTYTLQASLSGANATSGDITVRNSTGCNALLVNSLDDDAGNIGNCKVTLRLALAQAAARSNGEDKVVRFDRNALAGEVLSFQLNTTLPNIENGVGLDGGCGASGPGVEIKKANGANFDGAVNFKGNNHVRGLKLVGPPGSGMHAEFDLKAHDDITCSRFGS